jgi:hypothetical protein
MAQMKDEVANLTVEQLLEARKKLRSSKMIHAFLIGLFLGIAVWSAAKNGFGFATFFPLFFVYLLSRNTKASKALDKELENRNAR